MSMMDRIDSDFDYHPPSTPDVAAQHEAARAAFKTVAQWVASSVPRGREQSTALTKLEEGLFWTNAAIARHQGEG